MPKKCWKGYTSCNMFNKSNLGLQSNLLWGNNMNIPVNKIQIILIGYGGSLKLSISIMMLNNLSINNNTSNLYLWDTRFQVVFLAFLMQIRNMGSIIVLVYLGNYNKFSETRRPINNIQLFLTALGAGSLRSRHLQIWYLGRALVLVHRWLSSQLCPHISFGLFHKDTNPIPGGFILMFWSSPKDPTSKYHPNGARASIWIHGDIQAVARMFLKSWQGTTRAYFQKQNLPLQSLQKI